MLFISTNERAQIWYADFIIGLLIFILAVSSYYYYYDNEKNDDSSLENLMGDARTVSSYLAGAGLPLNWTSNSVIVIGLTDDNSRVNTAKLNSLNSIQYSTARTLLNTKYDFYIYFQDKSNCVLKLISDNYGYGHPDAKLKDIGSSDSCLTPESKNMTLNLSNINPKKVVRVERILIYNSTVSKMVLNEWAK